MSDKTWEEMDGWGKAWEVTKVVGGVALIALSIWGILSGHGPTNRNRPTARIRGGGSVWTVGHGGKKDYGSWSSFRHN